MKIYFFLLLSAITVISVQGHRNVPETGEQTDIDWIFAEDYCSTSCSTEIEGIWDYTEEGFTCLIMRNEGFNRADSYRMIVLESEDARLIPGVTVGHIFATPERNTFDMYIYTSYKSDRVCRPKECMAKLSDDAQGLILKHRRLKFSINPVSLLPWIWRLMTVRVDDPLYNMPRGLVKIKPLPLNAKLRKIKFL